jgi:hypothetical protein
VKNATPAVVASLGSFVTGNFHQHRETGVEAGGRRGFFFILGTIANSKNVTEEAARDFCVHGFHGFHSHANSQIFRLFPCSR